jgi:hypothetical protein
MEVLQHTDVYRTYDVTSILSLLTTLDRVSEMLKGAEGHSEVHGLLNVEDEVYVAAALGCTMGILRHPLKGIRPGKDTDLFFNGPRQTKKRMDEVVRARFVGNGFPALGVTRNATRSNELSFAQALMHNAGSLQDAIWLKIPRLQVGGSSVLKKVPESRVIEIYVVASPPPHTDDSIQKIEVRREVVPEVIVANVIRG